MSLKHLYKLEVITTIEDEFHVVMSCPFYADLRETWLGFKSSTEISIFVKLSSTKSKIETKKLALFVNYALIKRTEMYSDGKAKLQ